MQLMKLAASWSAEQAIADAAFRQVQAAELAGNDAEALAQTFDRQSGRADDLAETIAAMSVKSAAEAAAKFRILLQRYGDGAGGFDQAGPIFAFLADLEALAAREAVAA